MKKLSFTQIINAAPARVWEILWSDESYRRWTSVFSEGSHAESDWKLGSKVHFLDGKGRGMFSQIEKMVENEVMRFHHLGELVDGVEVDKTSEWGNTFETYYLKQLDMTKTELLVELDAPEEFDSYFNDKFPQALKIVKELSEQ